MDRDSFALGSIPVLTYAHKMPVMQAKAFPSSKLNSGSGLFDDSYSILLSLSGGAAALPRLVPTVVARRPGGPYVAPGHLRALVVDALRPSDAFLDLDPFAYVLDSGAAANGGHGNLRERRAEDAGALRAEVCPGWGAVPLP